VHRERAQNAPEDLPRLPADLAGELYQRPPERFLEYGCLRADAMDLRDSRAEGGELGEAGWRRIEELLNGSWRSLWKAINR